MLLLTLLILCLGGVGGVFLTLTGQPNEIRAKVTPATVAVAVSEEVTIELAIENVGLDTATISSIGVDQKLLDGVEVVSMTPAYRAARRRDYPLIGAWSDYKLDQQLFGGSVLTVTLVLRGVRPGTYGGDVTVWVESELFGLPFERARRESLNVEVR